VPGFGSAAISGFPHTRHRDFSGTNAARQSGLAHCI